MLLLVSIWAAVLVPPAVRAHNQRRADFVGSFGRGSDAPGRPRRPIATRAHRRRHILGGLLIAMAATLVAGLLPPFRILLVVHLFLVDSFLAYVTLLVHLRRRQEAVTASVPRPQPRPVRRRVRRSALDVVGRARMPDLSPVAGAWTD